MRQSVDDRQTRTRLCRRTGRRAVVLHAASNCSPDTIDLHFDGSGSLPKRIAAALQPGSRHTGDEDRAVRPLPPDGRAMVGCALNAGSSRHSRRAGGQMWPPANAQSASVGEVIALGGGRSKVHVAIVSAFAVRKLVRSNCYWTERTYVFDGWAYSRHCRHLIAGVHAQRPWAQIGTPA